MRLCPCRLPVWYSLFSQQKVWVSCYRVSRVIRVDFLEERWRWGLWLKVCKGVWGAAQELSCVLSN